MIIYPAIDLRGGHVVRLKEGDPNRQTTFSTDPLATAQQWIDAGASWIHMVNLDGAFASTNDNGSILRKVAQLKVNVQFGGGLRQMADIVQAIEHGASRVVLGTVAVQHPELVEEAVERFGTERICVALDARDGIVTTHGWQQSTGLTPVELGQHMRTLGASHALYTDVSRDGGLQGVNVNATAHLAQSTGLNVIASGGVSTLDDIRDLRTTGSVAGAVIGMALYEGRFTLQDALMITGGTNAR